MRTRGLLLAALHVVLAMSIAGKFFYDRQTLPRAWARTVPYDPNLPIRGRYVRIQVEAEPGPAMAQAPNYVGLNLSADNGRLVATPNPESAITGQKTVDKVTVLTPLAFFIPERVPDPSVRAPGEELWAEVTVTRSGKLRPIRLGVRKDGVLSVLPLN